jgi:hypothetical protein
VEGLKGYILMPLREQASIPNGKCTCTGGAE